MAQAAWWQRGVIYQIYPRSFQDSNGDGVGDLEGIRARLPYLAELGTDAIWISPIYPSPMADFGYDISDYCGVDPRFGTLGDFDRLIADAHRLGLKVVLDFVPNHTSDRHPWFLESRASRESPKRDWYIWRDGRPDSGPPNNWLSNFGGSAWELDPTTGQFYYHAFLREQPDLNWRNPEVREAMYRTLRFWLDRGVDGFRVDVIWHLMKDAAFRDNPPNPAYAPDQPEIERFLQLYSADQPEVHEVVAELRRVIDAYRDRVLIGEIYLPLERMVAYYGKDLSGAHLPFNFQLLQTAWTAHAIAGVIDEYERLIPAGGWPNWVLGNHDRPRIAARVGPAQARVAAVLLLTLRGTPTMYYGDELGIGKVEIPPEAVQDPWEKNEPGLGLGRDPVRTPMQWSSEANAGFTTGTPWLPLTPDWDVTNVEAEDRDPGSMLGLYRKLLAMRRAHPALALGGYRQLALADNVLAYARLLDTERLVVALNFGASEAVLSGLPPGRILLSTHGNRTERSGPRLALRPDEAIVMVAD